MRKEDAIRALYTNKRVSQILRRHFAMLDTPEKKYKVDARLRHCGAASVGKQKENEAKSSVKQA